MWFTVDTGASKTIVSDKIFEQFSEGTKNSIISDHKLLSQANGEQLNESGKLKVQLQMGNFSIQHEVYIANITDEVLLGIDCANTIDILTSEHRVEIDGKSVPCIHVKEESSYIRKVIAVEDNDIPAFSEAILEVKCDNFDHEHKTYITQPMASKSIIMANSVVDKTQNNNRFYVRVLNPGKQETIHKNTVLGYLEPCEVLTTILNKEDNSQVNNTQSVKRVQLNQANSIEYIMPMRQVSHNTVNDLCIPAHLETLYKSTEKEWGYADRQKLLNTLIKYQDCFSKHETDLGLTHLVQHSIDTGTAKPVKQPPRRPPMALAGEETAAIEKMLSQGVIRESSSPWASPIVLVKKKDGKIRTCIDYRQLNKVTRKDAFPLPKVQECLDALSGSAIFTTLDLTSGYHQVSIKESDIPKTAFVSARKGLFEFVSAPFGLCNMPATFQRVMELALRGLQWTTCLIYLDDVIIMGRNFSEHLFRFEQVLERIKEANFKLKSEKCHLFQKEVTFLGHVVSEKGVKPDPRNIEKSLKWRVPQNVSEVKQFLGLCSYYRRFIRNFSMIAKPLNDLTRKESKLKWTDNCQTAFDELRAHLIGPDIMAYPVDDGNYILDTDASDYALGAVLSQIQSGQEKVIAYASRSLSKSEKNYCVTDKELLAVVYFVEYFRHYLLGREFLVRSDHQALRWLFTLKEPKGRVARWLETLSAYHFSIEYRPGKKHTNADSLSRCYIAEPCKCPSGNQTLKCGPCKKCKKKTEEMQSSWIEPNKTISRINTNKYKLKVNDILQLLMMINIFSITVCLKMNSYVTKCTVYVDKTWQKCKEKCIRFLCYKYQALTLWYYSNRCLRLRQVRIWAYGHTKEELRKLQRNDRNISKLLKWKESSGRPYGPEVTSSGPEVRHYWLYWTSLELHDGLLFKRTNHHNGMPNHKQLIVPKAIRDEIIQQMHNAVLSGHLGRRKTVEKILQQFYWYELRQDVEHWIKMCKVCAANKGLNQKPRAYPGDMRVGAPLDRLSVDILGPLPITSRGNRYILVVIDGFSKWMEAYPVPDQTAETCAAEVVNNFISRFGCPLDIHTDQGRNFESELFKELCRLLEIRKTRTTPRRPQGNGQVERMNRVLIKMIRAFLKGEQRNWDVNLSLLSSAYRSTPNETTGFTPNMLMLGREVNQPILTNLSNNHNTLPEYVNTLRDKLNKAHEITREHLQKSMKRHTSNYDGKGMMFKYKPGDPVWILNEDRREGFAPKLQMTYTGPYIIYRKLNELDYEIQYDAKGNRKILHYNKLKPYDCTVTENWVNIAQRKIRKKVD